MNILIVNNKKTGDKKAFEFIKKQVIAKPDLLIGLAVGKTTDGLYKLLSRDSSKNPKVWRKIKVFQIDENIGVPPSSPLSFNYEIKKELKDLLCILNTKNIFLMDGTKNPQIIIRQAYKFIKQNNEIDLIILGLGPVYDPHIAYNTTGKSSLNSRMRVVDLHPRIVSVIARKGKALTKQFHKHKKAPEIVSPATHNDVKGITIGIKDILETKKALLIAYGKDKAKSVQIAFKKVDIKKSSASALLSHKDLTIIIDKDAARYN